MINARMEILSEEVLSKCKAKGIEVYVLKKSKANTIAFSTNCRRRREFEITFLKDSKYRISTRFLGYKKVMMESMPHFSVFDVPDEGRIRSNVNLPNKDMVNRLILNMLESGFSEMPTIQR